MQIVRLFASERPQVVLTHPCEGGHPDHDATAFAVHAAADLLRRRGEPAPELMEMSSYHLGPHGLQAGAFLSHAEADRGRLTVVLDAQGRARKQSLLDCYASQRDTLEPFRRVEVECFRPAPAYDFREPPHEGALFYEQHGLGLSGAQFRGLASQAMARLGLEGRL
jgi:LmbE family N-acetylglucosaminyl deacetylase